MAEVEGEESKDWAVILEVPPDKAEELAEQLSLTCQATGEKYLIVLVQVVAPTAEQAALLIADKAPGYGCTPSGTGAPSPRACPTDQGPRVLGGRAWR